MMGRDTGRLSSYEGVVAKVAQKAVVGGVAVTLSVAKRLVARWKLMYQKLWLPQGHKT